jgi:hypothetical protein
VSLDLAVDRQKIRGSRLGGSPSFSARRKTQPEAAESRPRAAPACDFCRSALPRGERHRLVWDSAALGAELILAELCSRCATGALGSASGSQSDPPDALRLVQEVRRSAAAPRVVGFVARGAFYLLIAVTFFVIVTLISSYAR